MPKIHVAKGTLWKVGPHGRESVDHIDVPEYKDCCKLDCCTGGIFTFDIADPDTTMVIYFENGQQKFDTVAVFKERLALYE